MFHSRSLNNNISRLQGKCLHVVYNDSQSYEQLLRKTYIVLMCNQNLQFLVTKSYTVLNGLSDVTVRKVFPLNDASVYIIWTRWNFFSREVRPVKYGTDILAFMSVTSLSFLSVCNKL